MTSDGRGPLVVVDYGVNNVGSVVNLFRRLNVPVETASDARGIAAASALVLPGIGAFDAGVTGLRRCGVFDAIRERVLRDRVPILGICLGMQLLSRGSEEGSLEGLNLVPASTRRLTAGPGESSLKIPHMGWNEVEPLDADLFAGYGAEPPRFYFVHSFHVVCDDPSDVAARCTYGSPFTASLRHGHIFGTQFHPEKSHRFGKRLLANFARAVGHA